MKLNKIISLCKNEKEMILFESELINVQEYKLDRWVQRLELNEK